MTRTYTIRAYAVHHRSDARRRLIIRVGVYFLNFFDEKYAAPVQVRGCPSPVQQARLMAL